MQRAKSYEALEFCTIAPEAVVPIVFSIMDPFHDLAASCGPLFTYKWSLLEKAIISFECQNSSLMELAK